MMLLPTAAKIMLVSSHKKFKTFILKSKDSNFIFSPNFKLENQFKKTLEEIDHYALMGTEHGIIILNYGSHVCI